MLIWFLVENWLAADMSRRAFPRIAVSLFLVFLIPSGLLFVAVGYLVYQQRLVEMDTKVTTVAQAQATRASELVTSYVAQTRLIAGDSHLVDDLQRYLEKPNPALKHHMERHLEQVILTVAAHVRVHSLSVRTADDRLLFREGRPEPDAESILAFTSFQRQMGEEVELHAVFRLADGSRVFRMEKPLFIDGKQQAILRLELVQPDFVNDLMNVDGEGRYYIVGRSDAGEYLYFSRVMGEPDAFLTKVPPHLQGFLQTPSDDIDEVRRARMEDAQGINFHFAAAVVPFTPWYVVAEQQAAPVLLIYLQRLVVVAIGLMLIGAVATIIITRMYSARVMNLSNQVSAFVERNPQFSPPTAVRGQDELANLTNVTMAILDHIERSRNRLRATVRNTSQALSEAEQELRTLDEKLIQSAKLAAIGEVTTGIAHELNQPLGALRLKLEGLRRLAVERNNEKAVVQIEGALEYVQRMTRLTMKLRRTSRSSDQSVSSVNVIDCVYRASELFAMQFERSNVRLKLPDNDLDIRVHGNAEWLEQITINLLANARDAVDGRDNPFIEVACTETKAGIALCVSDNGPGVAAENRHRIFDAFYTGKVAGEGTGLGLSICRRLLTRMDGDLRLDETYNKGARFIVQLQRAAVGVGQ